MPGNEWVIIELGHAGTIRAVELDTAHYKGNYPDRASLQAGYLRGGTVDSLVTQSLFWRELMPEQKLAATIDLIDTTKAFMEAGIRLRHPQADAREVQARCAAILCGPKVARRLYGLDVTPD